MNRVIQIIKYLRVLQFGLKYLMIKIYKLVILSDSYLCGIYCTFKKKFMYSIYVKIKKNIKGANSDICTQNIMSSLNLWANH